jgi:hypothetical protein
MFQDYVRVHSFVNKTIFSSKKKANPFPGFKEMEFLGDTYQSSVESVCLLIQIWDIKITDTNLLISAKLRCNNMF